MQHKTQIQNSKSHSIQIREICEIPRLTTLIADYFTRNLKTTKDILIQLPEELLHQWLFKEWINYGCFTYNNLMLVANSAIRRLDLTKLKELNNIQQVIDLLRKCSGLLELNLQNQHQLCYPAPFIKRPTHSDGKTWKQAKKMTKELRQEMKNHPLRSLTLPKTLQLEAVKQLISCAPNLVSLDISSLTDLRIKTFEWILRSLSSLENLYYSNLFKDFRRDWSAVDCVATILGPRLRSLRILTGDISVYSLVTLAQKCPNLEILDGYLVEVSSNTERKNNTEITPEDAVRTFAKSCTKLSVFTCVLNKTLLNELISSASQLRELCAKYADDETLEKLVVCCPNLTKLDLVSNTFVTDKGVQMLVKECKNLSVLLLTGCSNVTPTCITSLRHSGLQLDR